MGATGGVKSIGLGVKNMCGGPHLGGGVCSGAHWCPSTYLRCEVAVKNMCSGHYLGTGSLAAYTLACFCRCSYSDNMYTCI